MKAFLKFLVSIGLVLGALYTGQNSKKITNYVGGKERYVVITPANKIGAMSALKTVGANVTKSLAYQGGIVVDMTAKDAEALTNAGHEVYKDRLHHAYMGDRVPCPVCPDPTKPVPTPTDPTKPVKDRVPWGIAKVNALAAQARVSGKVMVAVLDTGVDTDHEDLIGAVVGGRSFVQSEPSYEDFNGHGTHCIGTVAAVKNDKGVVGVAAGIAEILAVKVLDGNGSGYGSDIADGIYYAVAEGAKVISMSLGSARSGGADPLILRATNFAVSQGVIVVAAAGNDGVDGVGYPAANPGVFGISSSDNFDRLSGFSTYGYDVDYIGPGSDVESTKMGGGYTSLSGTSMATPHVAGVFALCIAFNSNCRELETRDLGLGTNQQGKGLPDALLSVTSF